MIHIGPWWLQSHILGRCSAQTVLKPNFYCPHTQSQDGCPLGTVLVPLRERECS